ncbi:MAG: C25 family cysteine peptidase, partial [bacterium]
MPRNLLLPFCAIIALSIAVAGNDPTAIWQGSPQSFPDSEWSIDVLNCDITGTQLRFECPGFWLEPVMQNGAWYTSVTMPRAGNATLGGFPELPVIGRLLAIPADRAVAVVVHEVSTVDVPCEYPCLPAIDANGAGSQIQALSPELYPEQWVEVQAPVIFKDYRLAPVNIHPVRYDASTKTLQLATRIEFELRTTEPSNENVKTHFSRQSNAFDPLYKALIDNRSQFNTAVPLVSEGARGAYLIFVADNYLSHLQNFITWKSQLGYQVIVKTLSTVGNTKEQIKAAITAEYYGGEVPLDYVLLIGDIQGSLTIPAYYITKPGSSDLDVTDHPYVLLEGQDYFPDAMIGRISVASELELITSLQKVMVYQKTPPMSDPEWLKRALLVAGNYSDVGIAPITPVWTSLWLLDKLFSHGYT